MREAAMCVSIVLGVLGATWLTSQALIPSLLAAGVVYALMMHCPPFNLAADFVQWRRDESERWVVVSRKTVFDQAI